ncbi:hypothetical protein HUN59_08900, partial [Curtobacterium sp. Csp2]
MQHGGPDRVRSPDQGRGDRHAGRDADDGQPRDDDGADPVRDEPAPAGRWSCLPAVPSRADAFRRRTRPALPVGDPAGDGGTGLHLGSHADVRARHQGRAAVHDRVGVDPDPAETEHVAVDPVPGEVDLGFDRRTFADREHAGHRRERVQVDALTDPGAERAGVVADPRRAGRRGAVDGLGDPLREPDAHVHRAATGVVARADAEQDEPGEHDRERHLAHGGDEHREREHEGPPGQRRQGGERRRVQDARREGGPGRDPQPAEDLHRQAEHRQQQPGRRRDRADGAPGGGDRPGVVECLGQRADPRVVVHVGDGRRREAFADGRDELRRGQRAAAVREEVVVDALPTRTSGKVDRAALPWPLPGATDTALLPDTVAWIAERWAAILGVPVTSVDDDFFAHGGGSLTAAQLVSAIRERFPTTTVADVYDHPRIGALAEALDDAGPVA